VPAPWSDGGSDAQGQVLFVQRPLIRRQELLVGLGAGVATILGCALILLLLGLIPLRVSRGFFGVWYGRPLSGWFADAFLAPFWGLTTRRLLYGHGGPVETLRFAGPSFGAVLVYVGVLWAVGWQVRRRIPPTLRQRTGVLLVAGLAGGGVVAVAAAVLGHTLPTVETDSYISAGGPVAYDPFSYFFGAFALTLLAGAFCFGVVGLLAPPWAAALRRAGALVGACFLAAGLLFPVFVVSDGLPHAKIGQDIGLASGFSAAAGGLVVPLALQAPVSLEQMWTSPWVNYNAKGDGDAAHWMKLAISTALDHPRGRLYQHVATLGIVGSLVGAVLSLAAVCALVLITWGLCRGALVRTARGAASLGLAQGGAIVLLLAVTLWLSSYYSGIGASVTYWGITAAGFAQSAVTIVLACGLTGLAYGIRESRRGRGPSHSCSVEPSSEGQAPDVDAGPTSASSGPA
jgi:hypothetical protein